GSLSQTPAESPSEEEEDEEEDIDHETESEIDFTSEDMLKNINDIIKLCEESCNIRYLSTLVYMSLRHFQNLTMNEPPGEHDH
ncbi:unnamed protein product, partial [Didymodactylos carnosus]